MAAVVLLVAGAMARADCLSTTKPVSVPVVFPNLAAGPIAWSGSILGVAKTEPDFITNAIYFATYDSDLQQLTDDRKVADTSFNGAAALSWDGHDFRLYYQTQGRQLVLQRIDANGNPIGSALPMDNHPWSPDDEFDVIWAAGRLADAVAHSVTQGASRGLWMTLVTDVPVTNVTPFIDPPTNPRLISLPTGTIGVLWLRRAEGSQRMFLSLITTPGTLAKNVSITDRTITNPRIATNGTSILIVYAASTASGGTELRAATLDAAGNIVTPDVKLLSGTGIDIVPTSLMWNPALSEWALVYTDAPLGLITFPGATRLRRFTSLDASPSDTIFSPNPLQSLLTSPYPIVFANGGYIGSIQRILTRAEGSESYLVKTCPFAVTASVDHPFSRPVSPVTFTATPSGGTPGYSYEWDFGDLSRDTGAVVQHIYLRTGTYTVTLTGTDAAGAKSSSRLTVQVAVPRRRAVK